MYIFWSLIVVNLTVVFGLIVLHTGPLQLFHMPMNQLNLSDLLIPPNLESYGWVKCFQFSWCFVLVSSFIVRHLNSKKLCGILLPHHQQKSRSVLQVLMLNWFSLVSVHSTHSDKIEQFDKTTWISFKLMQPVPSTVHSSTQSLVYLIVCVNGQFLAVQSKSSETCQHVMRSGCCRAIRADTNCFLFLLSSGPLNPSLRLSIRASIFCSFPFFSLSLPLSRHPGSHAPLCGLVRPFLPPLSYHTHWLDISHA